MILTGKYYVCVRDYVLNDRERMTIMSNRFIDALNYERGRRYSYGISYTDYTRGRSNQPKFHVGNIYRASFSDTLIDDNHNSIKINEENENNFVAVDFVMSNAARHFIAALKTNKPISAVIEVIPTHMVTFPKDYEDGMDLSNCIMCCSVTSSTYCGTMHSWFTYNGAGSVDKAVYEMWTKIREKSKLCSMLRDAMHLPYSGGRYEFPNSSYSRHYGFNENRLGYHHNDDYWL